jgi:hypothetical protein
VFFLELLQALPGPAWSLAAGIFAGTVSWLISRRKAAVDMANVRLRYKADTLQTENAERAAFRASLMTEIGKVREEVKECEAMREQLRKRVNALEEEILVLRASNEIMQRWVSFFKQRDAEVTGTTGVGTKAMV